MRTLLAFVLFICAVVSDPCNVCRNLVNEFNNGLRSSEKSNFGGGNTAWEEEKLGNFATSETRLIHIIDRLCPSSVSNRDKCQYMREEMEESLEKWWFNQFKNNPLRTDLFDYLCVNNTKVCCPYNHYGSDCSVCKYFHPESKQFCNGHGYCNGNGTKDGTGECDCDNGYSGESCDSCTDVYFRDTNGNCSKCDVACETCTGPDSLSCLECASGFNNVTGNCMDIDECKTENCSNNEYCLNKPGSYSCENCDSACANCTGPSALNCHSCATGYQKVKGSCEDINECSADSTFCRETGQKCVNLPGTYECKCEAEYVQQSDGSCKLKPPPPPKESKKHSSSSKKSNNKPSNSKRKSKSKKIWTRKFEREFFKVICSIFAVAVISYFLGRYVFIVVLTGVGAGYYIYFKSIRLDQIFSKS